jgi:hypothetical protein
MGKNKCAMACTPLKTNHPNYASYGGGTYEVGSIPQGVIRGLEGLLQRHGPLRSNVDLFRSYIPQGPTGNWGSPWLDQDMSEALSDLSKKPLHKMMDAIAEWTSQNLQSNLVSELEELLVEYNFGYQLVRNGPGFEWQLRDDSSALTVTNIESAKEVVVDVCEEALRHLQEAITAVEREGERARKNAIRDAMSAMESLYKAITKTDDIADAWKTLRADGSWGPTEILKDGYSIWNHLHHMYPDIRHGQATGTDITAEEAHYWIDRICAIVRYLAVKKTQK